MSEFFAKIEKNPHEDLFWNLPETKKGTASVIGGNSQRFQSAIRIAEDLFTNYPLSEVKAFLPASLKAKLPPLANLNFLPATENGAFSGEGFAEALSAGDFQLLAGDFSKNTLTGQKLTTALKDTKTPTLLIRDTLDLIAEHQPATVFENPAIILFASAPQLQKLLKAIYYPKVLTLSQSLVSVCELLHKLTLSFPLGLVTLYNGQVLVAQTGQIRAISLEATGFTPLTIWNGQLATRILALNLYNPANFLAATVAALFRNNGARNGI